jgi:nucleotide-binding universal stress UspA family protein
MKNILVPVGSSENGINNLKYAINFASISGATVYLININKEYVRIGGIEEVDQFELYKSGKLLSNIINSVNAKGIKVITKPIKGDPFVAIKKISKEFDVDLIITSPQSVEIDDKVYLGTITAKLLKQTEIPLLIVPKNYLFRKFASILVAFKNGHFEKENVLLPIYDMVSIFKSKINLLQVITPETIEAQLKIDQELLDIKSTLTTTKNATTFQGVLEHFQSHDPDMLCVIRRKRGFFKKLWEKNSVLKRDFHTSIPLLILSGNL